MKNAFEILHRNIPSNHDRNAIVEEEKYLVFNELLSCVRILSSYLINKEIIKGDRIAIFLPNSIEFAVSFFACLRIGAIAVPINPKFKKNEIRYYIKDSHPNLIITSDILKKTLNEIDRKLEKRAISIKGKSNNLDIFLNNQYSNKIYFDEPGPEDKAIYLYSTGSTGIPKRVTRTHENLISLANNHSETVGWDKSEKILFTLPISHTYALGNFIAAINSGMTCYMLDDFNRKKVVDSIKKHKITIYPCVPFVLKVLAESNIPADSFSSLNLVISAGAPLPKKVFAKFGEKFGIYPRQLYGSSETGVISINLDREILHTYDSVGKPVKDVEVKIIKDNFKEAGINEEGEIIIKSPTMTKGYDNLPIETEEVFKNGYYYTGDTGLIDESGNIYIKGRKKLLINISGNKVDPVEVEDLLIQHPNIMEAAVTGHYDDTKNESIKAYIVTNKDIEKSEIYSFLKEKISGYKIPKYITFLDEIPKSPTGKVLRDQLD